MWPPWPLTPFPAAVGRNGVGASDPVDPVTSRHQLTFYVSHQVFVETQLSPNEVPQWRLNLKKLYFSLSCATRERTHLISANVSLLVWQKKQSNPSVTHFWQYSYPSSSTEEPEAVGASLNLLCIVSLLDRQLRSSWKWVAYWFLLQANWWGEGSTFQSGRPWCPWWESCPAQGCPRAG